MLTLFFLAIALAVDGMAVSMCRGASSNGKWIEGILTGVVFGIAHGLMLAVGWWVGDILNVWKDFAPWIAFSMLSLLGGKLLWESYNRSHSPAVVLSPQYPLLTLTGLVWASLAVSIDCMAAGITLPLLGFELWFDAMVVGLTTMAMSMLGYYLGSAIGDRWGKWAEVGGGVCLILIGLHFLF